MEVIYVCQYCGGVYKTEKDAKRCEEKAERIKNKFKRGQVVCDEDEYKYRILGFSRWRRTNFTKRFERASKVGDASVFNDFPLHHCFEYELEGLDEEIKGQKVFEKEYLLRNIEKKRRKGVGVRRHKGI